MEYYRELKKFAMHKYLDKSHKGVIGWKKLDKWIEIA